MLEFDEVERLLGLTRDASSGGNFEARFAAITSSLGVLVPSTAMSAIVVNTGLDGPAGSGRAFFRNLDPRDVEDYATRYLVDDPCPELYLKRPGVPLRLSDALPAQRFGRDSYTGELLARTGIRYVMGLLLQAPDGSWLSFGLHRERGLADFTDREQALLRIVGPDLARAAFSSLLREKVAALAADLGERRVESVGAVVFDEGADIVHADRGALALAQLLAGAPGGFPPDELVEDVRRLARPDAVIGESSERVLLGEGGKTVRVRCTVSEVAPVLRVVAMLESVNPGKLALEALLARSRLTPREREVAILAAEGASNGEIGHRLGLSPVTVNVHMGRIFRKTGLPDRTALVRYLAGPTA